VIKFLWPRKSYRPMLHHVTVECAPEEAEKCIRFYQDLGLRVIRNSVKQSIWFREGVHVYWGVRTHPHNGKPPANHLALVLGDQYEATRIRCRGDGHFIEDGTMYWGSRRCYLKDPANNRVEIIEFAPPQ
jgi:catechol 2,3-dioxygenase-like lactoylglutathione lyase family enzyme